MVDHPRANGVMLQQMALIVIGTCTMLLVAAQYFGSFAFGALVIFRNELSAQHVLNELGLVLLLLLLWRAGDRGISITKN